MNFLRSKRAMAVVAAVALTLFLVRPGAYRLRHRIAASIGTALGRKVEIANVRIRVLPQPGFDLEGLVIHDDPAFSAEPMVRAQEVSANIRLRSLLRGRLEIARLSATEPSINLVRNHAGRWNLANLLERNAHIPVAPTGKAPSEPRPAFPYLEATHARINFKLEHEKKPYALTDADVGLWQESENSWGARMKAEPVRTDFNLTDTGVLRLNATWQRAATLRTTPLQVSVRWENGQLGQITKLLSGRDRGWRGAVSFSANLSGTPEALLIRSQAAVAGFHRYDIVGDESLRLSGNCKGRYSVADGVFADVLCDSPLMSGLVKVTGSFGPMTNGSNYDLRFVADQVPLTSLLRVLRQAKKQLPPDLAATGLIEANLHAVRKGPGPADIDGEGMAENVRLLANGGKDEVTFGNIPLKFVAASGARAHLLKRTAKNEHRPEAQLRLGTFPLPMGGQSPATAGGWLSRSGYELTLVGDATLRNLFRLADTMGLGGARPAADGVAKVSLNVSGSWHGFAAPVVVGTAQLHNVRVEMRGVNTPIEIATASVSLTSDATSLSKIAAHTGVTHWSGSASAPRQCPMGKCVFRFDLAADRLSSSELYDWFAAPVTKRPWYRILDFGRRAGPSPLLSLRASGRLQTAKLELKKVLATQVTTRMDLDHGKITLSDLHAQLLQGTHQGSWTINVSTQPPKYQATGTLQEISLAQLTALTNESWVTGTGDARFDGTTAGITFADLLANANASFHFTLRNGVLPHVARNGSPEPFSLHRITGDLRLENGTWELSAARLESHDGIYQVSGKTSPEGSLNFTLVRSDERSWTLSGPLAKLRLERTSHTQAEVRDLKKQ